MALTAKKVYAILKRQISDMEAKLNSPVRYRGTVATADLLPLNPDIGDMYNIESKSVYGEAGMNVAWNGVVWDTMGAPIDMSLYIKSSELADWVKQQNKPTYTAEEVGALPADTKIPSKTSDLQNDSGFLTKIPDNYLSGTDKTLSVSGKAADAKTVGDKNVELLANILSKLDKNQGSENSGKIAGINESGDIVPMFPVGVEYNEETNCLEFGSDQGMKLNQGIGLDSTLTKTGFAADAGVTGKEINSLKEDIGNKIIQSVNLFDGKIKQNYYIDQTTGEETAYTDWCCSDFIKVNPSIEYYCYALNSSNVFSKAGNIYYAFYDKNKRYITGNIFYNNVSSIISNNINVNYIRISGVTSVFTSFLIFGEKAKIDFIDGKDRLSFIPFETSIPNINKMFNGKILMTYGDSITAQGKWQPYVKNECGFYKVIKHGYPGDRLMRLACTDYIDTLTEDFDILTVMGGTNDFGQDRVIGKPTDVNTDDKDSSFTGTFYGGLNLLIPSLMTKFPKKRIVFITPVIGKRKNSESFFNKAGSEDGMINSNGNTIRDFANAIIDRCEYYGMPYIDLTMACGWNKYNISNYCQNEDENFIHPNENGAIRMATFISSQLKNFTN